MKKIISILLSTVMVISFITINSTSVSAATFQDINQSSVFLKQQTNYTCTLSSAAMMVRRASMMAGKTNWSSVTESSMRGTAWVENSGLKWSFTYNGISVGHGSLSANSSNKSALISLLSNHPEGIVAYNGGKSNQWHAVLLTDYTNGTFYCADPAGSSNGRVALTSSTIVGSGQDGKVANFTAYWYVTSPKVTLSNSVHTHNYQLAYFWAAHPHHNEYKCSCGASYVDKNSVNYYGKCTECNSFTKIKQSCYNIKNVSKGSYLNVSYGKDVNGQNVDVYNSVAYDATRFLIIPYGDAYKIHPICSSKRMLNVWGNTPSSGANVTIYDDTSHGTQLWKFKKVSNGYIIHSVYDMSLVLDASSVNSNNVVVAKYNGSNAQVWNLIVNCTHPDINTSSKISTYFSEGYRGKKVCKTCGKTISKGKTIAKKAPTVKYKAGNSKIKVAYKHVSGANGFQVVLKRGGKKYIKTFYTTKSVSKYISAKKGTYRVYTRAFNKSGKSVKYSSWTKVQYLKVK